MYVHKHTDENDVESRQIKETIRKEDKKASSREFSPALQPKSANSNRSFGQKQSGLKSRIPLKRTDSNAETDNSKKLKIQPFKSIEKTYRKGETEQEWAPESPFDFSAFDNKFYEQENIPAQQQQQEETFPSLPRQFTKAENTVSLAPFEEEKQVVADFITPSTIEYGPEKEIELPFAPEDAHIIQFGLFTAIADLSAYEAREDDKEIIPEFEQDEDYLYLQHLFALDNEDFLYFECPYELTEEEDDNESIDIPFHDSLFDTCLAELSVN